MDADADAESRDRAEWLRRLAEPTETILAARALRSIELAAAVRRIADANAKPSDDPQESQSLPEFATGLAMLVPELDHLIPGWIARFGEQLETSRQNRARLTTALAASQPAPMIDMDNFRAVHQLQNVLQAAGDRIDPYIGPIIHALGSFDPGDDDHAMAVLEFAGPAAAAAVPKLMEILRERGITRWPSHIARALANASRFDDRVIESLTDLLSGNENRTRRAAIEVLGTIGPAARSAAGQLLALSHGDESEHCRVIWALSQLGETTPELLAVLDDASRSESGYVRRSAVHALGKLTPDSARFVPWLIAECDWADHLHDETLPEAAVAALGQYGPRAHDALPRLRRFIEGPIKERTVSPALVRATIDLIAAGSIATAERRIPRRRVQPLATDDPLFAVRHEGKLCYIDRRGRIVLATRFSSGEPFNGDRAIVHDDAGRTFLIDREGRDVFQSGWAEIRSFSQGLAAVCMDRTWGFVNREGREVIEPQYDSVTSFSEGLAGFEVGRIHESPQDGISWSSPGRRGFIDQSGSIVIPAEWIDACPFHEGRSVVCTGGTMKSNPILGGRELLSNRKYGYIDRSGRVIIPGEFDIAHSFSGGRAVVQIGDDCRRRRHGYIDDAGNRVIPLNLTAASDFHDGLATVRRRGRKWRETTLVIDPAGEVLAKVPFRRIQPFSERLAAATTGDLYGFIDINACWVIEPQFDLVGPFTHGLAEVQRGDWYGLIDVCGNFVWGPTTEGSMTCAIEMGWTS